jgi:hypothetical protein
VVRVHVGPIASDGVSEWIAYARGVLEERRGASTPDSLPPEVLDGFIGFLDEWDAIVAKSPTFLWETDVDPEQIEFLALALYRLATDLAEAAQRRGYALMPAEGLLFYRVVVNGFLDAMTAESRSLAAYAEELRSTWPGLAED